MIDQSFQMLPRQLFELPHGVVQGCLLLTESTVLVVDDGPDPLGLRFNIELTTAPERNPCDLHLLVRFEVLVSNDVLETSVVSFVLQLKHVDVEDVVPEEVPLDVLRELLILLLDSLSLYFTDVALILLVILPGVLLLPETSKSVQHQTAHNASEHYVPEDERYHIVTEPRQLELLPTLTHHSSDVETCHTVDHFVTHLGGFGVGRVEIFHVVAEGYRTEDVGEDETQGCHV